MKLTHWVDHRIVFGCLAMVSLVTFVLYGLDKRAAEAGRRRTPEATLHGLEFLGGWPTAFLAQRFFRHKISKIRYQVAFGLIVLLHEAVAFEDWQDFYYSRAAVHLMNQNGTRSKAAELPEIHPADR